MKNAGQESSAPECAPPLAPHDAVTEAGDSVVEKQTNKSDAANTEDGGSKAGLKCAQEAGSKPRDKGGKKAKPPRPELKIRQDTARPTREDERCRSVWQPLVDADSLKTVSKTVAKCFNLQCGAVAALSEGNPRRKAVLTLELCKLYFSGQLCLENEKKESAPAVDPFVVPDIPARDILTVAVKDAPKRGKGGNMANIVKLIHSLAHIESVAVDLSWDIIARFGFDSATCEAIMPRAFFDDWVEVAEEEAIHHLLWEQRLHDLGSFYGEFACHNALWDSAQKTSTNAMDRLCVEHCVLEARGLDVAPKTFTKFINAKDELSAYLLECIFREEIEHVRKGMRWFRYLYDRRECANETPTLDSVSAGSNMDDVFHHIVSKKMHGKIKGPFNDEARAMAGMDKQLYDYDSL